MEIVYAVGFWIGRACLPCMQPRAHAHACLAYAFVHDELMSPPSRPPQADDISRRVWVPCMMLPLGEPILLH